MKKYIPPLVLSMNAVKVIAFVTVFCLLFSGFSWLFRPYNESYGSSIIHYEQQNTIDVLFAGSSHIYSNINPNIIWREEGIASFDYAGSAQAIWTSYYYIREAVKLQKPLLVVLDVLNVSTKAENDYDDTARQVAYSTFPTSLNKLRMIQAGAESGVGISWFFDLLQFHTRWQSITEIDLPYTGQSYLQSSAFRYKGFGFNPELLFSRNTQVNPEINDSPYPYTDEKSELPKKNLMYLLEIIELSKKEGFELLLIKTPSVLPFENEEFHKWYNAVYAVAEENGINFIDLHEKNHRDAMGFDYTTDLFDGSHMNGSGQTKLSKYLASYLKAEYDIPDRRGDPGYQSWDEAADEYFLYEAMESAKQITELPAYLDALKDISQNLIFITGVRGGADAKRGADVGRLSQIGITEDTLNSSYICVYEPSSGYVYEGASSTKKITKNVYKEGLPINIEVISAGNQVGNTASIKIDGKEQAKNLQGLNIVIYDKKQEKVFDSFSVDISGDESFIIKR